MGELQDQLLGDDAAGAEQTSAFATCVTRGPAVCQNPVGYDSPRPIAGPSTIPTYRRAEENVSDPDSDSMNEEPLFLRDDEDYRPQGAAIFPSSEPRQPSVRTSIGSSHTSGSSLSATTSPLNSPSEDSFFTDSSLANFSVGTSGSASANTSVSTSASHIDLTGDELPDTSALYPSYRPSLLVKFPTLNALRRPKVSVRTHCIRSCFSHFYLRQPSVVFD